MNEAQQLISSIKKIMVLAIAILIGAVLDIFVAPFSRICKMLLES